MGETECLKAPVMSSAVLKNTITGQEALEAGAIPQLEVSGGSHAPQAEPTRVIFTLMPLGARAGLGENSSRCFSTP